jgi:predicted dehydrogenase
MKKLRLGIIGTGSVVREIYRHLYFHSDYAQLISIEGAADPDSASLHGFCDPYGLPHNRRFSDYAEMIERLDLDAVQVNTPDHLHRAPTVHALERGLDVLVPKPLAESIADAHEMVATARQRRRLLVVDFHKRGDPRIREAAARYRAGAYGRFQLAVWYMLDKLLVADPNHAPRFFASADFAERNSPISFLTVHMVDAFLQIIREKPTHVRATAYAQKLPSLAPIAVDGYDVCDTEVVFESGGVAHILTGWHLPNTAHALTVQSSRIICTEGMIDLQLDATGCRETVAAGANERNPLFRNFDAAGTVSGYGIEYPGELYRKIMRFRAGDMDDAEYARMMGSLQLGYWATVVCEAAHQSLAAGIRSERGVVRGGELSIAQFLRNQVGELLEAEL